MQTLNEWIEKSNLFITDLEEIADLLSQAEQIFLYDTVAISLHESVFHRYGRNLFKYVQQSKYPIIITDTIAKEMRILEDTDLRYVSYLQQFQPFVLIREADFFSLLLVEYHIQGAQVKFRTASEKAFAAFQPLCEQLSQLRKASLTGMEKKVFDAYDTLCTEYQNKNRGELSILWLSCILEYIAPNARVRFIGIDQDLYQYVTRCYFQSPYHASKKKPRDIGLASSDTLLQATYLLASEDVSGFDLNFYIDLYRNPERYVLFFERWSGIRSHQVQRRQLSNDYLEVAVREHEIDIVY